MASKKDLAEAQSFSRRRLLTAFTAGAVGTTELEPAKPLRAVVAGLALTALVVVGGVFYGLVSPGLPAGWQDNRLVLAKDTGARYVSSGGTLYPVVNTASARLLIPSSEFAVVTTTSHTLASVPVGEPVGILGAPDQLPAVGALLGAAWTACGTPSAGVRVTISRHAVARETAQAALVRTSAGLFVVAGTTRYAVDAGQPDAVLRAIGLGGTTPTPVDDRWLNLFDDGAPLAALVVPEAGRPAPHGALVVGQAVHVAGSPDTERYLVQGDGTLALIDPLAYQLYLLGTGAQLGAAGDVSAADIAALPNATQHAGPADWPSRLLQPIAAGAEPCALAGDDAAGPHATLALATDATEAAEADRAGVRVDVGSGALVRAAGRGAQTVGQVYLVDATGTAFPVDDDQETLARLGYRAKDVAAIGTVWIDLLPVGPGLTAAAAGAGPAAGSGPTAASSPTASAPAAP